MSKVVYKDCDDFYIGKTKRRLHDRKTEHFKALAKSCHTSAIADHITSTGHNIKWDHFDYKLQQLQTLSRSFAFFVFFFFPSPVTISNYYI